MRSSAAFQLCRVGWRPVVSVFAPVVLFLFSSICSISATGEVLELSVTKEDGEYVVMIVAVVDAPEDYVYLVVTDYKHVYRINPTITTVDVQDTDRDGVVRVQHHSKHSIGPFRFSIDWGGDIVETKHGHFNITTIPEISSFDSGSAIWVISPQGNRTWVLHESKLKPKFFIPPVIGDFFIKRYMREATLNTFYRIECHAQIMLERDNQADSVRRKALLRENEDCIQRHRYEAGLVANIQ